MSFSSLKDSIVTLEKFATDFHRQMQTFTTSIESLTQGFGTVMTNEAGTGPECDVAAASQVIFDFRNCTQDKCVVFFEKEVVAPLKKKIEQIRVVEEAITNRGKLKQEYDYYYEKVNMFNPFQHQLDLKI